MNLKQISLTPMTTEDTPLVERIERECQLEPWSEHAFARELTLPHSSILIARMYPSHNPNGGRPHAAQHGSGDTTRAGEAHIIAGYICTWLIADEIQIHNITVAPPFRSQGIGRMLLDRALHDACGRSAELAILEVRKSNVSAILLYKKTGFVVVGERLNYYTIQPEPAILMEKKLP